MLKRTLAIATAVLALSACDQITGTEDGLAPTEVAELADGLIQDGISETGDSVSTTDAGAATSQDGTLAASMAADSGTMTLTRTRECRLGGEVSMTGTREWTRDRETRSGSMDFTLTRTFTDCARPLADSTVTITLNGDVTMTVHREWSAGSWSGGQEISILGSIDWFTDDDRSGTCEIDIQATFDPETRTREVTGEACGEDVAGLRGWSFGPLGHGPGDGHGPHHGGRDG